MKGEYDRRCLSRRTGDLICLLALSDLDELGEMTAVWGTREWQELQLTMLMQGVGPYLHVTWRDTAVYNHLPAFLQTWLAEQYAMNKLRLERMQAELVAILQRANRAGIPIMPLKGSTVAWRHYSQPWLRPMADLDLLIHPADRDGLIAILQTLGYQFDPADSNAHAQHMLFMNPDAQVISVDGEHPDNPRPVELHWRLQKGIWGGIDQCDFTESMWAEAATTTLLGETAWLPSDGSLAAYVAFHASGHLLFHAGRLTQWLDLALISRTLTAFPLDYPNWTYPALRLAERAWPTLFAFDLGSLQTHVHPRLLAWGDRVPLDGRAGLTLGPPPHLSARRRQHWNRWWPTIWRMRLGYYHLPLPLAYARHFYSWGIRLWQKYQLKRRPEPMFRP